MRDLLHETADLAADFLESLEQRPVFPRVELEQLRASLGGPIPEGSSDPSTVISGLSEIGSAAAVAIPSGRYFGFVIGGAVPAALAADWLTSVWDQNAGLYIAGPAAAVVEEVAGAWLAELLRLPSDASFAFVTGTQMAHVTALAAARHHVLEAHGWDVERRGLQGAPPIRVVAGAKRHVTLNMALRLIGLGTDAMVEVPADDQGRMRADLLRDALRSGGPAIVCAQAGEVNTGAFDPFDEIADAATEMGAWLHVDGAFGLWAAASPALSHLTAGTERADSWAVDGHKWLNVPYDSGIVFCARPDAHRAAMSVTAEYLIQAQPGAARDQMDWTPEFSRRARGFAVCGDPVARPQRHRRARRALLRSRTQARRGDLVGSGCRGAERRRPQSGALPVRIGRSHRGHPPGSPGGRCRVDERDHLGRSWRNPPVGQQLVDERGGRRADSRRVRPSCL
jgi:pyridoxal-dependent decarboxylase-like protein